ncbi:periplasmic binding protein-like II [Penicillium nucicola]|uniref:periplasmic binding protein-like II n=1 Tax=Penicillium nucicola TaxID=1850975 RepID=UPI0025459FAD|nr:periplasmic binding protein-like II [Penicillium nucicola]KAJ5746971.1 periplasmic binding protein-like II [Penicillium nucicola]
MHPMHRYHLTATGHNLNYLPEYIARRHGYFKEQGLDFDLSIPTPWDGVLEDLKNGTADMALGGIWVPAMYRNRAKDYTVFAQIANRCPLALIRRTQDFGFKLSDVVGSTVLLNSSGGASVGLFFKMLLRQNALDPKSVNFIQDLDGAMLATLFEGGMGDYFVTDNLSALAMTARNPKISIAMEMVKEDDIPWSVYYRETATITQEVLDLQKRFCIALNKGIDWVLRNDAESFKEELSELFPGVSIDVVVAVTNSYRENGMWSSTCIPRKAFNQWQLGLADACLIKEVFSYEEMVNDVPAKEAQLEMAAK